MNKPQTVIIGMAATLLLVITVICVLFFSDRDTDSRSNADRNATEPPAHTAVVALMEVTDWYSAIGTVRPKTESRIESLVTAQVIDVGVQPGSSVTKGQLLIRLDDRQLSSRLDQAGESLKSAEAAKRQVAQTVYAAAAGFKQAKADYDRTKTYFASKAATAQMLEKSESLYLQAKAGLERSRQALQGAEAGIRQAREVIREATIAMGYTRIKAPQEGVVLERFVDPGDLALPGKPLLSVRTAGDLRLEAFVREGLIGRIHPGSPLKVTIHNLDRTFDVAVDEIVPYADPQSRTFLVKAPLPATDGLYPGMFGKLLIPAVVHQAVVVPAEAIRRVGQLELVTVRIGEKWQERHITTGRKITGRQTVEVLSGLDGGETIGWKGRQS